MNLFHRYGFFRYKLPAWFRATTFRLKHGYDYRDCWNLDYAICRWLAPRLRHLSEIACGAPCYYPNTGTPERWEDTTDWAAWRADLTKAADALESYVRWEDHADTRDFKDTAFFFEIEQKIAEDSSNAMKWVAEWFHALWD